MRYLFLIYDDERRLAGMTEEARATIMDAWFKYTGELQASGKMLAGEALQPTPTATTVRLNGARTLVSDGPFAETKEQLGGYFVVDASDLDQAIEWASKMPHLPDGGSVEIRPIMEFDLPQP